MSDMFSLLRIFSTTLEWSTYQRKGQGDDGNLHVIGIESISVALDADGKFL